jgi:hypothetical protein
MEARPTTDRAGLWQQASCLLLLPPGQVVDIETQV